MLCLPASSSPVISTLNLFSDTGPGNTAQAEIGNLHLANNLEVYRDYIPVFVFYKGGQLLRSRL